MPLGSSLCLFGFHDPTSQKTQQHYGNNEIGGKSKHCGNKVQIYTVKGMDTFIDDDCQNQYRRDHADPYGFAGVTGEELESESRQGGQSNHQKPD